MTSEPRRLHPAAVGAEALSGLRQIALPIFVVAVLGTRGPDAILYALLGVGITLVVAYVGWRTTRWYLEEDGIRLRTGIVSETIRTVPYDRVQSVDTVRGPVQRLFGVVALHVQSAGGGRSAEIVLKAVTDEDAEELREAVRRGTAGARPLRSDALGSPESPRTTPTAGPDPAPDAGPAAGSDPARTAGPDPSPEVARSPGPNPPEGVWPLSEGWRLGTGPLLVAALTSGSLGVLIPVVAGASQFMDDVFGAQAAERLVPDDVGEAALLVAAVLVVAWVLSFFGTIVSFAGFSVVRDGERLRIRRGIVERREASVPVARVHAVRIIESPLREPFRVAQVRIETAGYANERATAQTLLPLVRRRDVPAVLARLLPELDAPLDAAQPVPARAARRYALRPAVLALVPAAAAIAVFGDEGLAALALVPLGALTGLLRYRFAAFGVTGDHAVLRSRSRTLARTTATADARRLQSVHTSASPFQRRGRLATIGLDVSSGRRLSVVHVDDAAAARHLESLAAKASAPPPR